MEIGFIGLGLMGRPMAGHLLAAGHALHLWARRPETLEAWRDRAGVRLHGSAADVARYADLVFTVVADAPDVEQVTLGARGLAEGARPGLIVIDMSTIAPAAARDIGRRLEERGIEFLDAPVSGGETGAIDATLTIMVGGKQTVFERARPLLECLGQTITHIGPTGAGQVAKACNQILTAMGIAAVAEAFNFARASGVDPARVREALLGGFAASRILDAHGQRMLERNFRPGFKAWMHQKDLRIVMAEAQRLGLTLPGAAATTQLFNALVGSGGGEEDSIAVLKLLERLSGYSDHGNDPSP
ncbi:2-hydroxy-3-oxopropionate reductase [Sterolibacterium denitrificans]|uniref:2-hydroxy-3-oxopropionate reductase n=1 Tax=Sterolibacterium denitrificans TaxID=157592 RepID=A0A7Z7HQ86_9PROT|nr:NAD(P)-dependent oxidoreductase [Sterolibacterium denitrificans]SMB24513.1 2-hydroxy-3-oxopropionate reductase [Sterolibacterium denitrificans]